jgi:RecA/RadA recombinase
MKPKATEEPRKKIDLSKIPRDNPDDILEVIQSLAGEGVVVQRGQDLEGRMDLRRSSGLVTLDIACNGGLPAGGLCQIDGSDGIGKNLLLYHYFARCQKTYGDDCNIMMVCFESVYDKVFGRKMGVKVALSDYEIDVEDRKRKDKNLPPLTKKEKDVLATDQVGKFHIVRGSIAERMLQVVADATATNSYQIMGIDSWDAMLPQAGNTKDLEDNAKVADASGVQTRWMSKVFGALTPQKICPSCLNRPLEFKTTGPAKYVYLCRHDGCGWKGQRPYMWENETTLIGIRQVRANLNKMGMHARDTKVGGSHALRHGKMIDIELRKGESILEGKAKIGKEVNWEITKGKAGTHEGLKGMFRYFYSPPRIDVASDLLSYALPNGIIEHTGKTYSFQGTVLGTKQEQLLPAVTADGKLKAALRKAILVHAELGYVRYR